MMRLDKKLIVLRAEQEAVKEEGEINEALGARVAMRISAAARPAEASKYRLHVEEVGKITSLLLSLSGRLARAENALYGMPADHAERVSIFPVKWDDIFLHDFLSRYNFLSCYFFFILKNLINLQIFHAIARNNNVLIFFIFLIIFL